MGGRLRAAGHQLVAASQRLQLAGRAVAQTAVAAGLAWLVATAVLGYEAPFFAPIGAAIALGTTAGRRSRRTGEMVLGVAVGIAVGDALILVIGTGAWQITVVVALAVAAAQLLSPAALLSTQAAVSAILVATLQPPTDGWWPPDRFVHALVGGIVAVVVAQVLLPLDPVGSVRRSARPVFDGLSRVLSDNARALARGDAALAQRALDDARAMDPDVRALHETLAGADETAHLAPVRRRQRGRVDSYGLAATQVDLAVRNTRVLARATIVALRWSAGDERAAALAALGGAVDELAAGVSALAAQLLDDGDPEDTRRHAVAAAARTREAFPDVTAVAVGRVVGQIRSTVIDLLRSSGMDLDTAQATVDEA